MFPGREKELADLEDLYAMNDVILIGPDQIV